MQLIGWGGERVNKALTNAESALEGIKKNTKIEAHVGMAGQLVRDLAIEEALQDEIK